MCITETFLFTACDHIDPRETGIMECPSVLKYGSCQLRMRYHDICIAAACSRCCEIGYWMGSREYDAFFEDESHDNYNDDGGDGKEVMNVFSSDSKSQEMREALYRAFGWQCTPTTFRDDSAATSRSPQSPSSSSESKNQELCNALCRAFGWKCTPNTSPDGSITAPQSLQSPGQKQCSPSLPKRSCSLSRAPSKSKSADKGAGRARSSSSPPALDVDQSLVEAWQFNMASVSPGSSRFTWAHDSLYQE